MKKEAGRTVTGGQKQKTSTNNNTPYLPVQELSKRGRQRRRRKFIRAYAEKMGWTEEEAREELYAMWSGPSPPYLSEEIEEEGPGRILKPEKRDTPICLICKALQRRARGFRFFYL